jgi:hypothetical protein
MSLDPPPRPALRASDADREAVAAQLRMASVDGRIDSDELEERLAQVYAARWVMDLDRIVADVVPPPPPAPPPGPVYLPPVYVTPIQTGPTTNGLAVASLVAALFWFGWFGSVGAVICGHLSLSQIKKSGGREGGSGLAIAGLVLGYLELVLLALVIVSALASS